MSKKTKGILAIALSAVLVLGIVLTLILTLGGKNNPAAMTGRSYTYHTYAQNLPQNWSPHGWQTSRDAAVLEYLTQPLCTITVKDSQTKEYQWVYEMATSITDVTESNQDLLVDYGVTLPAGKTAEQVVEGYVYEIKLNSKAKWQDGTPINAESYVYSMEKLLSSEINNYRANLYREGKVAVAGGALFSSTGTPLFEPMVKPYTIEGNYNYDLEKGIKEGKVYVSATSVNMTLYTNPDTPMSLEMFNKTYALGFDAQIEALKSSANNEGYTLVTQENLESVKQLIGAIADKLWKHEYSEELLKEALWVFEGQYSEKAEYADTVGCIRVDDYTLYYITQNYVDRNSFLAFCSNNWLVHKDTYDKSISTVNGKKVSAYGTSIENTMSYGPYKLQSIEGGSRMVLVQNENWYGWKAQEDGTLVSHTTYAIDGKVRQQYQTTQIVIDVMSAEQAKQAFARGELSALALDAQQANAYSGTQMLTTPTASVMSFFFNTNLDALKKMDAEKGNVNSIVLSSDEFREAMSLAINRAELVTATTGYTPAYGVLSELSYYDIYQNTDQTYRQSEAGKKALCDFYAINYGEGEQYQTLDEAYSAITGQNMEKARQLMENAAQKFVLSGNYTPKSDIKIRVAWTDGGLPADAAAMIQQINRYLNTAAEYSMFGTITLEPVGGVAEHYAAVAAGDYAIGYGAWSGGAFSPFRAMQPYCDPFQYTLHEAACWDPTTTDLTLEVGGEPVTMTWYQWANAFEGEGIYAKAGNDLKLSILGQMETQWLKMFYRIPLATASNSRLVSYQISYYTSEYNIMYGNGGFRLLQYHYDDAQWAEYVRSQGGTLSY